MAYRAVLAYDQVLVRKAILAFMQRSVLPGFAVTAALLVIGLVVALIAGGLWWLVAALATALLVGAAVVVGIYRLQRKNLLGRLAGEDKPEFGLTVEEDSFRLSSALGQADLEWSVVTEIWCYAEFWLLLFSRSQFVLLPLQGLEPGMAEFIRQQVGQAGGQLRDFSTPGIGG